METMWHFSKEIILQVIWTSGQTIITYLAFNRLLKSCMTWQFPGESDPWVITPRSSPPRSMGQSYVSLLTHPMELMKKSAE